ncbi:MAG: AI-2E family transporter, partial [Bacilli bacterium]
MIKNKLDFKLINLAILFFIIYLMYQSSGLWINLGTKIFSIFFPFLISFSLAYALYPYTKKIKGPKAVCIFIVLAVVIAFLAMTLLVVIPMLFTQLGSLFNAIIAFFKEISMQYDLNFGAFQETLSDTFNKVINDLGKYVSNGALSFVSTSFSYISTSIITLAASVYFLIDMDNIRKRIKKYYKQKSRKSYNYVKALDESMKNYLEGFTKIVLITIIEYTIAFGIIGHPNAILLGFLAALGNLIPYFGGLITNIIAAITAFVISPALFIKTLVVFLILSIIDSYIINPYVYGKSNEMHPIIVILSVFAGGILFGIVGIMISLPVTILIITTFNFYRKDIDNKIE